MYLNSYETQNYIFISIAETQHFFQPAFIVTSGDKNKKYQKWKCAMSKSRCPFCELAEMNVHASALDGMLEFML